MNILVELADRIKAGDNFAHIKLGDGEMIALLGAVGQPRIMGGYEGNRNFDGSLMSGALGRALWTAYAHVLSRKNSYFGSFIPYVEGQYDSPTRTRLLQDFDQELVSRLPLFKHHPNTMSAWALYHSNRQEHLDDLHSLFATIARSPRPKIFVGPERLGGVANMLHATHIKVPLVDCFDQYEEMFRQLRGILQPNNIVMLSCGLAAKVLTSDGLRAEPCATFLDLGSAFDPLFVGETRPGAQMSKEELEILYADLLERGRFYKKDDLPVAGWTTVDQMAKAIESTRNFSYIKFGDGEQVAMMGFSPDSKNCDGCAMPLDLKDALWEAYRNALDNDSTCLGTYIAHAKSIADHDVVASAMLSDFYRYIAPRLPEMANVSRLVSGGTMLHSKYHPNPAVLFQAIGRSARPKVFVGPERLAGAAMLMDAHHVVTPLVDAFAERNDVMAELEQMLAPDTIIMFCCGFAAKVFLSDCLKVRRDITCLDLGSSFDPLFVGETRTSQLSRTEMERLYEEFFPTVSILIPTLGRPEGLRRCFESIAKLRYPSSKIEVLVDDSEEPTVPQKVKALVGLATGRLLCYASNDVEFTPDSLIEAVTAQHCTGKRLVAFNTGVLLPDQGNICQHFIVDRSLLPSIDGEIFDTEFRHCGVDNLLYAKCVKLGEFYRAEKAVLTHYHFSTLGRYDEVYDKGWRHVEADRALLAKKLAELG